MPTQEERITALEQKVAEYRPVLQNIAYELTMVKGLIVDEVRLTQEMRREISTIQERLTSIEQEHLTRIEEKLDTILALLKPS